MIRTDQKTNNRKTVPDRENLPDRERGRPELESLSPSLTLRTLLSGASPERLSPGSVLTLSHTVGNSALLELISRRGPPQDRESCPVPPPLPEMDAAVLDGGEPALIQPVAFAGLPPIEAAAGPA